MHPPVSSAFSVTSRTRWRSLALAAFFLALALLPLALAHAQVVGGTISGIVLDSSGAVIPNARVIVRNEDTGAQRILRTNASGAFAAPSIPVGSYDVSSTVDGFAPY